MGQRKEKGDKKLIILAIEILENDVGRAYAEMIEHASAKELGAFLRKRVSKEATIIADEWLGYSPLKEEFPNLEQIPLKRGKNFKDLHIHIMNIRGWLRGIHHHCSKERCKTTSINTILDTIEGQIWIQSSICC